MNEAKRIQEGAAVNTSGRGATLQLQGAVVKVTPVDGLEGPNLAAINEQSISLSMYGFNVCKLQSNISDAAKPDRSARAFGTAPASR
ncbi:MAG: hypothetical protein EOP05_22280 [Proteobacteria bacterium]|nr:MAG: hypothetical protein EOP05_22280 [Pseudomonadota bacterium]